MKEHSSQPGFTLLEMLVVTGLLIALVSILLPGILNAREAASSRACASNLRQLYLANTLYASQHGSYVPGAENFQENQTRWHGTRENVGDAFSGINGPLTPYLGGDGNIRRCPEFNSLLAADQANAFEASCGGYGYNMVGVGSTYYLPDSSEPDKTLKGLPPGKVKKPQHTVMFADTALGQPYNNPTYLIEYSFAEPYYFLDSRGRESQRSTPSVHFRHGGEANVVWCDGHVTSETPLLGQGALALGWIGPEPNNELFDPY